MLDAYMRLINVPISTAPNVLSNAGTLGSSASGLSRLADGNNEVAMVSLRSSQSGHSEGGKPRFGGVKFRRWGFHGVDVCLFPVV